MVADDLSGVVCLRIVVELTIIVHERLHAGGQVQHSVHQLTQRGLAWVLGTVKYTLALSM